MYGLGLDRQQWRIKRLSPRSLHDKTASARLFDQEAPASREEKDELEHNSARTLLTGACNTTDKGSGSASEVVVA